MEKQAAMAKAEERYNDNDVQDPDNLQGGAWFRCVCDACGWFGLSRDAAGGEPTGGDDYEDARCPKCDGDLDEPTQRDIAVAQSAFVDGIEASEEHLYGDGPIRQWERADGLQLKLYPEHNHDGGFYFSWPQDGERWTSKLGPGDIMEALKEQGRTTEAATLEQAKKEALERYPVRMKDDDYSDEEDYDVNEWARKAFINGRIAGPLIGTEILLKYVDDLQNEVRCCHIVWDQCFETMGYDLSKGKPLLMDAVKKVVDERPRWIPVTERFPEPTEETEGRHSRDVLVKVVEKGKVFYEVARRCYYVEDTQFWSCGMNNLIVAWMEIPQQI